MRCRRKGFSLIEVVIAIAIVAGGVVVVLALLPTMVRNSENAADMQTALRLPDAVQAELAQEMGSALGPFANSVAVNGLELVVEQDGSNVRRRDLTDNPLRSRYFLIEVHTFATGEFAYVSGDAVLALQITVSWPYRVLAAGTLLPAGAATDRQSITFNLALNP
jgi:prepilin-type N-terminal cleavage/methylation domain-containing protein|uniref:prepilin-type N-terminal cleavage/methylation domain-containing protein n=1 Tax=Cephaloticoccus sp. TaxID=1985742 RepID=UPI00404910B1